MRAFRLQCHGIALGLALVCASAAHAAPLTLCTEDVAQVPWSSPDGTGLNLELLRRVEKLTGDNFVFVFKPWKRCVEEVRTGMLDGLIGASDSPARRQFSLPPLLPDGTPNPDKAMYEDRSSVFIRAGSKASWDGQFFTNVNGPIMTQAGYFVGEILRARGLTVKDTLKTAEDALRMLAAGGADVAVLQGQHPVDLALTDPRFRGKIEVATLPFANFIFYLVINKRTYDANPKRIDAIWTAIHDVRATAEYRALEAQETRHKSKN